MTQGTPGGARTDVDIAIERGWVLIALAGKRPVDRDWGNAPGLSRQEASDAQLAGRNLGLVTGARSGLYVIDIDVSKGGAVPVAPDGTALPPTVTVKTGGGGKHFYYAHPGGALPNVVGTRMRDGKPTPGPLGLHVDARGDGGQVVYPGSVHPDTGAVYEWELGRSPMEIDLAPLPQWVIDAVLERKPLPPPTPATPAPAPAPRPAAAPAPASPSKYVDAAITRAIGNVANATEGTRNHTLNREAYSLGGLIAVGALDESQVEAELMAAATAAGLPAPEASASIRSGLTSGKAKPRNVPTPTPPRPAKPTNGAANGPSQPNPTPQRPVTPPDLAASPMVDVIVQIQSHYLTELANARRLQEAHGANLRYTTGLGWLVWDGLRWRRDELAARRKAHTIGAMVRREAAEKSYTDPEIAKAYFKHARNTEASRGISALLSEARAIEGINGDDITWDADPWLLNCPNGLVDLRTGDIRPHDRDAHISKLCPIPYNPEARCPTWLRHLDTVFDSDINLIDYFQFAAGYTLTGDTHHDIFFICHGPKGTGKSTTIETIQRILGHDYHEPMDAEAVMAQPFRSHSCELAQLRGSRMVSILETGAGRRLNEALIKKLTGGDEISARFMRENQFTFLPEFKLWLGTNHKPVVRDDSGGVWRRVRLLPFIIHVAGEGRIHNIDELIASEYEGILAWMVEGAIRSQHAEPPLPEAVRAANQKYEEESDILGQFFTECCLLEPRAMVEKSRLYKAYCDWNEGGRSPSQRSFSRMMQDRGFDEFKGTRGVRMWIGVGILDESSGTPPASQEPQKTSRQAEDDDEEALF